MVKCERTFPAPKSLAQRKSYNDADVFAAFKRDFIRSHQSEYPELQEFVK